MLTTPENNSDKENVRISVEFSGGLELLFSGKRKHQITIPSKTDTGTPVKISHLVRFLCERVMQDDRREMFVVQDTVYDVAPPLYRITTNEDRRPGILVLINDADWELEGGAGYELRSGDNILFVSTLHGG